MINPTPGAAPERTGRDGRARGRLTVAAAALPTALPLRIAVAAGALVVIAVAYSALTTGTLAFIGDVAPADRESELMGLRQTARGAGGVLGPPILGVVATLAGYQTAFAGGSVLAFLAAGVVAVGLVESR